MHEADKVKIWKCWLLGHWLTYQPTDGIDAKDAYASRNSIMTHFKYELFSMLDKIESGQMVLEKWNEHILMYIYHKQCEFVQKIQGKS